MMSFWSETPLFQRSRSQNKLFSQMIFLNFAHGFITLKRKLLPHSFTAEFQLPYGVLNRPYSRFRFVYFFKITDVINFRKKSVESRNFFQLNKVRKKGHWPVTGLRLRVKRLWFFLLRKIFLTHNQNFSNFY